jgi:hypothetical protein
MPEKGNREKFRSEYRKALARASFDLLEDQNPHLANRFRYQFDKSHKATNDALNSYVLASEDPDKWYKFLAMKVFGMMNPIKGKLDPEKIGLTEYGKRGDWKDEYTILHAQIRRKGVAAMINKAKKEYRKAEKEEAKAAREWSIFSSKRRKRFKRAVARRKANMELIWKLGLISKIFGHSA